MQLLKYSIGKLLIQKMVVHASFTWLYMNIYICVHSMFFAATFPVG